MSKEKFLSAHEMMQYDLLNEKVKSLEIVKENLILKHKISSMEVNQKLMEVNQSIHDLKSKRSAFNDTIRESYGIESDRFGYDPETGEIKENKPETKQEGV